MSLHARVVESALTESGLGAAAAWDQVNPVGVSKQTRKVIGVVTMPLNRTKRPGELIDPDLFESSLYARITEGLRFKQAKKAQVPLEPEERKLCMDRKAVWNFHLSRDKKTGEVRHNKTPAVWKHQEPDGKIVYNTNTHRAWNQASTLKGAIKRFHDFIKGTA